MVEGRGDVGSKRKIMKEKTRMGVKKRSYLICFVLFSFVVSHHLFLLYSNMPNAQARLTVVKPRRLVTKLLLLDEEEEDVLSGPSRRGETMSSTSIDVAALVLPPMRGRSKSFATCCCKGCLLYNFKVFCDFIRTTIP